MNEKKDYLTPKDRLIQTVATWFCLLMMIAIFLKIVIF